MRCDRFVQMQLGMHDGFCGMGRGVEMLGQDGGGVEVG
jgi:hypothetical protein